MDDEIFHVRPWQGKEPGSPPEVGLYILGGICVRKTHFCNIDSESVTVHLSNNIPINLRLATKFWNRCPELRQHRGGQLEEWFRDNQELGDWLDGNITQENEQKYKYKYRYQYKIKNEGEGVFEMIGDRIIMLK